MPMMRSHIHTISFLEESLPVLVSRAVAQETQIRDEFNLIMGERSAY